MNRTIALLGIGWFMCIAPAIGQSLQPATEAEQRATLQILGRSEQAKASLVAAGESDLSEVVTVEVTAVEPSQEATVTVWAQVLIDMVSLRVPRGDTRGRLVDATFYVYRNGETVRTRVDLSNQQVTEVKSDICYPTKLTDRELDTALRLARYKIPEVFRLPEPSVKGEGKQFVYLTPIDVIKESPTFNHRLVLLTFFKDGKQVAAKARVDLTTRQVKLLKD